MLGAVVGELDKEELLTLLRDIPGKPNPLTGADEQIMSTMRTGERLPLKFDWSFNFGHLLTVIVLIAGFATTFVSLSNRFAVVERSIEESRARATKYIPMIETSEKLNNVQDDRIQNLAAGLQEVRKTNGDVMLILGNIREDVASVKARLSMMPARQTP